MKHLKYVAMASLLGYDACGIETHSELVEMSEQLVDDLGIEATFYAGSYVPASYDETMCEDEAEVLFPVGDTEPAPVDIADFDVIYTYPWPGEEELHFEMMRRHARPDVLFLTYGGTDGFQLFQGGKPVR